MQPVQQPTTSVPSAMPSITGLIATIEISKHVIASLSENEIEAIELEVMSNFNASTEDITTAGILTFELNVIFLSCLSHIFSIRDDGCKF